MSPERRAARARFHHNASMIMAGMDLAERDILPVNRLARFGYGFRKHTAAVLLALVEDSPVKGGL